MGCGYVMKASRAATGEEQVTFTQAGTPHPNSSSEESRARVRGKGLYSRGHQRKTNHPSLDPDPLCTVFHSLTQDQGEGRHAEGQNILRGAGLLHTPLRPSEQSYRPHAPNHTSKNSRGKHTSERMSMFMQGRLSSGTCKTFIWTKMVKLVR